MKKLQLLLSKGTNKTAQPATCLMVLLLSMVLIAVPNIKLGQNVKETEIEDAIADTLSLSQQNRRSLLFDTKEQNMNEMVADEELNFDEVMQSLSVLSDHEYSAPAEDMDEIAVPYKKPKVLIDYDVDWDEPQRSPTPELIKNHFNEHAKIFHENRKTVQSSGFNIAIGGGVAGVDAKNFDTFNAVVPNFKLDDADVDASYKNSENKKNSSIQIKSGSVIKSNV